MRKLTYKKVGDVVLDIDLHNNYIVRAMANYNSKTKQYDMYFYLREYTIEKFTLIDTLYNEHITFPGNYKTIRTDILKYVSDLHSKNYFQESINNYEFECSCFDIGCVELESKRNVQQ